MARNSNTLSGRVRDFATRLMDPPAPRFLLRTRGGGLTGARPPLPAGVGCTRDSPCPLGPPSDARLDQLGKGWVQFRARQVLAPHYGFVWAARAGGVVAGSDLHRRSGDDEWRLLGLIRVAHWLTMARAGPRSRKAPELVERGSDLLGPPRLGNPLVPPQERGQPGGVGHQALADLGQSLRIGEQHGTSAKVGPLYSGQRQAGRSHHVVGSWPPPGLVDPPEHPKVCSTTRSWSSPASTSSTRPLGSRRRLYLHRIHRR
jgi:hypothetical protein